MTVQRPIRPPTFRQAQIAKLLAYGMAYKAIADEIGLSEHTVKRHVDDLALLIPLSDEGEYPETFPPQIRVTVWAYFEYRVKPYLEHHAA